MTDYEIKESEAAPISFAVPEGETASKPGARLAEYRKKERMSVEQVASRLKMSTRQVQLIEADNYESLRSMAIARGFVRAYAKLLNVDPEPLVAMFPKEQTQVVPVIPAKPSNPDNQAGNRKAFGNRRGLSGKRVGVLIAVLIIVGILAVLHGGWLSQIPAFNRSASNAKESANKLSAKQNLPRETESKNSPASGSISTELTAPKPTIISEDAQPAVKPEPAPAKPLVSDAPSAAVSAPASAVSATAGTTDAAPEVAGQGKGALILRARDKSWIQILRADSTVLYERTLKPGQSEILDIREPVSITIGYAPGVEATYRGNQLELRTAGGSTVSRLNLD